MKVLIFFLHNPGPGGVTGGIRRFLEIAKRINKHGIEYTFIESFPAYPSIDNSLHYTYYEFKVPSLKIGRKIFRSSWPTALAMTGLGIKLAETKKFDLIVSSSELIETVLAAYLTSRRTGIPWTAVIQSSPTTQKGAVGIQKLYSEYRQQKFSRVGATHYAIDTAALLRLYNRAPLIAVSKSVENHLRSLGVRSRIFICGNGIDANEIDNVPQPASKILDGIYVGRHSPTKGIFEALEVFKKIISVDTEAKFAFVGGGDTKYIETLKKKIVTEKLEKNVQVKGYAEPKETIRLMKSSKVLLFPSHLEGFSLVVGEALACRLPVICYDLPVFRETWNCEAVKICEEGNVAQLTEKTIELLENDQERERLGKIGRKFVERYDWIEIARKEAQIYELIVQNRAIFRGSNNA